MFPQNLHLANLISGRLEASWVGFKCITLTLPQFGHDSVLFAGKLGKSTLVSLTFFFETYTTQITLNR